MSPNSLLTLRSSIQAGGSFGSQILRESFFSQAARVLPTPRGGKGDFWGGEAFPNPTLRKMSSLLFLGEYVPKAIKATFP